MATGGRDHLFVRGWAQRELYSQRPRPSSFAVPTRTRQTHGQKLKRQLEAALLAARKRRIGPVVSAVGAADGIYVRFESDPGFELALDSLEARRSGIELRSVRREGERVIATVFVPDGKVKIFLDKFERYLTEETPKGKPKHQNLVSSINEIRLATLESLWTDDATLFPNDDDAVVWWEVWLRQDSGAELTRLFAYCDAAGLTVRTRTLEFLERSVALVAATARQLVGSLDVLNDVAELRLGKQSAHEFLGSSGIGQDEAARTLLARVSAPPDDAPAVCVLDTGVNREHPLLASALSSADMHAVEPAWLGHDDTGHGTEMAGLALYGDLTTALANDFPLQLTHRLESSKILPPDGSNAPHLYGAITAEAIARAEANAPARDRVSSMAITATDSRDEGQPSSWSAELDLLASGADDLETRPRRLIVVSGGNVTAQPTESYFEQCVTEGIHDPGQAWNALTVGAYTELDEIQEPDFAGWRALAAKGDLSPSSTTSATWAAQWPTKPDLVMEGGNMAISPAGATDYTDSLSLLTAYHHPLTELVNEFETLGARNYCSSMSLLPRSIGGLIHASAGSGLTVGFPLTNRSGFAA